MKRTIIALLAGAIFALPLAGCDSSSGSQAPLPVAMTEDAVGYYCQMYVMDHDGPKAQIHLKGADHPLWFAQVSDAITYLNGEERDAEITAVYVNDMSKAKSWANPGDDGWLALEEAYFVTDSQQLGGMGTPEAIPFSSREAAAAFASNKGGTVMRLSDIPKTYGGAMDMMDMSNGEIPGHDMDDHGMSALQNGGS
jgi:copper chaperone NosL